MAGKTGAVLPVNEFIGHDKRYYLDLAVDSSSKSGVVWLRRRKDDGKFFLVVSVVCGHVLKQELSLEEAKELYHELPDRLPAEQAFHTKKRQEDPKPT